jgi:predicted RND superfamily exporter protein
MLSGPARGGRAFARLGRALARHPVLPVAACALAAAVGGLSALRVEVDPGNEALFRTSDPARAALARFDEVFSGDEVILLALRGPIFTEDGLARLERATTAAAAVTGVADAISLTNAKNIYQGPLEVFAWSPYERVKDGEQTIEEMREEVLHEPLFEGNLVSRDGSTAAVVCPLTSRDPATTPALRAIARSIEAPGFEAFVAGFPVERQDFTEFIRRDSAVFVPLVALVLAIMTWLFFRQLWGVVLPLGVVGVAAAVTLGLAGALGIRLNALTNMTTPVVMVVAVAASVNLCAAYAQAKAESPLGATRPRVEIVAAALARVGLPCLFTTLTCAIGFASLAAGEVPAIRDFGLLCAFGVLASYVAAILLVPPLLAIERPRGPGSLHIRPGKVEVALAAIAPLVSRRRWLCLGGALAAAALAALGIARLRVETDIIGQLPPHSDLARSTREIDRSLEGVNTLEVLFSGPKGAFRRIESLRAVAGLEELLAKTPGVSKTFSLVDILARLSEVKKRGRALPKDQATLDYELGILDRAAKAKGGGAPIAAFISADGAYARITARLASMPASRNFAVIESVRRAAAALPAPLSAEPTGAFVLLEDMTADLPREQVRGLAIATAAIVLAIGLFFRSLRLAALAAIPASLPILFVYGLMGWAGIDLSLPTAMISSIVLGLAVDSTILFLARYRDERRAGAARDDAAHRMLENAGQAVSYSNLTLVFGFLVAIFSSFPPVRNFGLLTAATIAASYLGALVLLPALIFAFGAHVRPEAARG